LSLVLAERKLRRKREDLMRVKFSAIAVVLACAAFGTATQAAETVVEIPSRPGQSVRTLIIDPPSTPKAAVVLISGGAGRLDIASDGRIHSNAGNQVIRTRTDYVRAGFLVAVPDLASDLKSGSQGVANGYRWSPEHAQDIGAVIAWLRGKVAVVHLIGTSRGALSVGNVATRMEGEARPNTIVITSGMLMPVNDKQPSVEHSVGHLDRITMPVLLMYHENDACNVSPPTKVEPFKALLTKAASVDVIKMTGGTARGDPCEAQSYHGYLGIDDQVVKAITAWLDSH
jgi:pimeloyl-ACP methyl ester carboxylesterase